MQEKEQRTHEAITYVGLRAHATVVGLLQLTKELHRAAVLDDDAVSRIKMAICDDLSLSRPPWKSKSDYETTISHRLDQLFSFDASPGENKERSSGANRR
jgi:hypothetical protein